MRWLVAIMLLAGCRQFFGIGTTELDDASVADAPIDITFLDAIPDAPTCAGTALGAGLVHLCVMSFPAARNISNMITTDTSTTCDSVVPILESSGTTLELCVITAVDITISANVQAIGSRPLVLAAQNDITVNGHLDVSSNDNRQGAGANDSTCVVTPGRADHGGGGGGGGGSFGGKGGNGGTGDLDSTGQPAGSSPGGVAAAPLAAVSYVRGGCPGGDGGGFNDLGMPGGGGVGAASGGAVYLVANGMIAVTGSIYASGRGGQASTTGTGGGAGGSGGLIGLDAPTINVGNNAVIAANGGAGAAGMTSGAARPGQDGTTNIPTSNAVHGTGDADGGDGSCYATPNGQDGVSSNGGGGGGGAGVGFFWVIGQYTAVSGAKVSPNVQLH